MADYGGQNVSRAFNVPSPYQTEQRRIEQQQKMAEMLQAQSMQPNERFSYNGIEARTPVTAGLAKMLQGFTGMMMQKKGLEEEKALGEKYRGEQSADFTNLAKMLSAPAMAGQAEVPARPAEIAPEERMQAADYGTPLPGAAIPAVAARRAGQIDPEMIGQFKTPEAQQMAMAQLLSQIGPKAPIKLSAGESLIHPTTFAPVYTAPEKQEFGTTPHYETKDGKTYAVYSDKAGNRKMVEASPQNQFTTGTVDAALKRDMDMYQFGNLSAEQRASLGIRLTQAGVDVAKLGYETGLSPTPVSGLPANAPAPNFGVQTRPQAMPSQPVAPIPAQGAMGMQTGANVPAANASTQNVSRIPASTAMPSAAATPANAAVVTQSLNNKPIPQKLLDQAAVEKMKSTGANENTLRDEYNNLTKDFRVIQDAHEKIKSVAATGAGDMSLLYSFIKLLDPGSVVRESEFAAAAASGSFGERVQGAMQRVLSGQRLPDTLRNDFIKEADNLYSSQKRGADRLAGSYTAIAKRMGLNPENIIVNYTSAAGTAMPPAESLVEGRTTTFANGQQWTLKNGKQVQVK